MINIFVFVFCLIISVNYGTYGIQNIKEDLEIEKETQLKFINKHFVKSIHTKFGDIVDCIDINKQPAFDHPSLKNHKLQRKPNFKKSFERASEESLSSKPIFGLENDQCPIGTVPIQRTTKNDFIQDKSLLNNRHILIEGEPGYHLAQASLVPVYGPYHGVSGINSIYNPKVGKDQISDSNLWIQNGQNKIVFGWQVAPSIYGDDATHIYSFWRGSNNSGCFNMQCPGFVQTHEGYYLGSSVRNISIYGGTMIEFSSSIIQDPVTKNWWLNNENTSIGYFPIELFSNMSSAIQVGWGGTTHTLPGNPSPQMGSGYFPDDYFVHACYFRQISFQNASRVKSVPRKYSIYTNSDRYDCFRAQYYGYKGKEVGYAIQFGGPGGNCGN